MKAVAAVLSAVVFVVAGAVAAQRWTPPAPQPSAPAPEASPTEGDAGREEGARPRPVSVAGGRLENRGLGPQKRRIGTAVRDLRRIGLWSELTEDLYIVSIGSRPGLQYVPEDGHLADARLWLDFAEDGRPGAYCEITFYATAVRRDLDLQRSHHERGLVEGPVPTLRQFWAAVLAHELAHCAGTRRDPDTGAVRPRLAGERQAARWEKKALRLLMD